MTRRGALRVALLVTGEVDEELCAAAELRSGLAALGHSAVTLHRRPHGFAGGLLERRGFPAEAAVAPALALSLARGRFDVVHALSPVGAAIARKLAPRLVFTGVAVPVRETLADRRLRLAAVETAYFGSDRALAATAAVAAAARTWLALELPVLSASDALGYERVYREVCGD